MATSPTRTRPRPIARSSSSASSSSSLLQLDGQGVSSGPRRGASSSADIVEENEDHRDDDDHDEGAADDLLASLDGDDFDPVTWINERLDDASPSGSIATASLPDIDAALSSLLTGASISRSDVAASISQDVARSSRDVPKLVDEMAWISKSVSRLQSKMDTLASQAPSQEVATAASSSSQDSGSSALARLAELHHLHSQLASYQSLLRLASSWSTLASDVSSLLTEANSPSIALADLVANLNSASMRLSEARDSLDVFGDPKEAKEKAQLLLNLTDGFEATVRPKLVERIRALPQQQQMTATPEDLEAIKMLANLLARIGRGAVFGECWRRTRREALLESWAKSAAISSDASAASAANQVQTLLAGLVALLSSERAYAPILFADDALTAVADLLVGTLQDLSPNLGAYIEAAKATHGDESLLEVIKVAKVMREGGRDILRILTRLAATTTANTSGPEAIQPAASTSDGGMLSPQATRQRKISDAPPTSPQHERKASLSRRRSSRASIGPGSKRLSIAAGAGLDQATIDSLASAEASQTGAASALAAAERRFCEALYSTLLPSWSSFGASERALLRTLWQRESQTLAMYARPATGQPQQQHSSTLPSVQEHLSRSIIILTELCEDSIARCLDLARGLAAKGLLAAVDDVVSSVLDRAGKDIESLCRSAWQRLILAGAEFSGSEWATFGEVAQVLAGMREVARRLEALHASLLVGLRESAVAMAGLDGLTAGAAITEEAKETAVERLVKLRTATGSLPLGGEVALLLEKSTLASDPEEVEARRQIVALAPKDAADSGLPLLSLAGTASAPPQSLASSSRHLPALSLLPTLHLSFVSLLRPLLHSLLLLPLSPLLSQLLVAYPELPHWTSKTLPGQVSNEFQLDMPSFSLGPTEVMQSVGEGLLGLVRELEEWVSGEDDGAGGVRWAVELMVERRGKQQQADKAASSGDEAASKSIDEAKAERRRSSMLPTPASATGPSLSPNNVQQRRQSSFLSASGAGGGEATSPGAGAGLSTSPLNITPPMTRNATSTGAASGDTQSTDAATSEAAAATSSTDEGSPTPAMDPLRAYLSLLLTHLVQEHLLRSVLPRLPVPPPQQQQSQPQQQAGQRMTVPGWRQLEADVDYLSRILGALDGGGDAEGRRQGSTSSAVGAETSGEDEEPLDERLRGWQDVVSTRRRRDAAAGANADSEIDGEVAYQSPWTTTSGSLQRGDQPSSTSSSADKAINGRLASSGAAAAAGSNNLETSSLRRMLFAQRNRRGGGADSPSSSSSSRPGSSGGQAGNSGYGKSVDLSAMNVGMGW